MHIQQPNYVAAAFLKAFGIFLLCSLIVPSAWGIDLCISIRRTVLVDSDFQVLVKSQGKLLSGIPVSIYPFNKRSATPVFRAVTGEQGDLSVQGLPPGKYSMEIEGQAASDGVILIAGPASNKGKVEKTIELRWPDYGRRVLSVRELRGQVHSNKPNVVFENVSLTLWTIGATTPLETVNTGPSGRFQMKSHDPGIYILRVESKPRDETDPALSGNMPVELDPTAQVQDLSMLEIGTVPCGFAFENCPAPKPIEMVTREIKLSSWPIRMSDAKCRVEDAEGRVLTLSNAGSGRCHIPSHLNGDAMLIASRTGYATLRQPVHFLPADSHAKSLKVDLFPFYANICSKVSEPDAKSN